MIYDDSDLMNIYRRQVPPGRYLFFDTDSGSVHQSSGSLMGGGVAPVVLFLTWLWIRGHVFADHSGPVVLARSRSRPEAWDGGPRPLPVKCLFGRLGSVAVLSCAGTNLPPGEKTNRSLIQLD